MALEGRIMRINAKLVILILLIPMFGIAISSPETQDIMIISTDNTDSSVNIAISTICGQINDDSVITEISDYDSIRNIPSSVDALILIGHGTIEGLLTAGKVISWESLYDILDILGVDISIVLACFSPTDTEKNIYGFEGLIDAEAGAILSCFLIQEKILRHTSIDIDIDDVMKAQNAMLHPLGSVLYFVHGYFGNTESWNDLYSYLDDHDILSDYDSVAYFDYTEYWLQLFPDWDIYDVHENCIVTSFAWRLVEDIVNAGYEAGTQIDIVSHSLGGLIAREMLRYYRSTLRICDIDVGRVITLGTPHYGTYLGDGSVPSELILFLTSLWGPNWDSNLLDTLVPESDFLLTLNDNPAQYSYDIEWTTISGTDLGLGILLLYYHSGFNDDVVAQWSAHLSFASQYCVLAINHAGLQIDPNNGNPDRPFDIIANSLGPEIDSDGDGLNNIEEHLIYNTDAYDSDSDDDELSDYSEVVLYNTNPNAWSTDGDILSDSQEIAWGYNPNNTYDPINAQELTYSAWQVNGVTGYVRANHYSAMDYVKVYVRYKYSTGIWTSYFYVGTDYTPTYYGDYYVSWELLLGFVQMQVNVKAYDAVNHYLGNDQQYVTLPGGGGKPGDPLPE